MSLASIGPALAVFVGVALLSALLVRAMIRLAVLDTPGHRSSHARPTPKGGGVGVMAAFLLGVPAMLWLRGGASPIAATAAILVAVALLALVSWLDDLHQFPPLVKLLAQAFAALLILWGIGPWPAQPLLGLAVGFGWLLFVTNALNFIDGLNGLAAGSMALACLFIGLTAPAGLQGDAGLVLTAGLIGFLPFNYPKALIFLGDVGSQGAGLAVATLGLLRWHDLSPASILVMPLLLCGVLYDVTFTLCRRWLAGERLHEAHRGHLYQVAFRTGMPAPLIALLQWGFVLWGAAISLIAGAITASLAIMLALVPQLVWSGLVIRRARRAALSRW